MSKTLLVRSVLFAAMACPLVSACRETPSGEVARSGRDAGHSLPPARGKPGDSLIRNGTPARIDNDGRCTFGSFHALGAHVRSDSDLRVSLVGGHLGAAWTSASGAATGAELRDEGTSLRPLSIEPAGVVLDASAPPLPRNGVATVHTTAVPILDPRSAASVTADQESRFADRIEVRCGDVVDAPFAIAPPGRERVVGGAMYACRTVSDPAPFVLGLVTPAEPVDAAHPASLRVIARREAIPDAAAGHDRFADAVWSIPLPSETAPADTRHPIDAFRARYQPDALEAVAVPGTGFVVAISVAGGLYVGWLSSQWTALGPLYRVDTSGARPREAAIAFNGHEAVIAFATEGADASIFGVRVPMRRAPGAPRVLAGRTLDGSTFVSPSITSTGSGEWVAAWVERTHPDAGPAEGIARMMPMRTDLAAREPSHPFDARDIWRVGIAARADRWVLAAIAGTESDTEVRVAAGRCPGGRYVAPPPVDPAGVALPR